MHATPAGGFMVASRAQSVQAHEHGLSHLQACVIHQVDPLLCYLQAQQAPRLSP